MGKYLDPRADLTFKKIFGEHKNLVISLLNALLPLEDGERVESIEYWPAEKIPERMQVEKDSIVDVCCKDNKNREFIVEMQMTWTESFKKRVLLNASKAYVAQTERGEKYQLLQPVYALNFVNAPMNIDADGYYHHYRLVHHANTNEVINGLQLVFIEMPKFQPQSMAEKKMQVLWLRFLTEISEKTKEAPAELLENAEVSEALKIVEVAAYTDAEMRTYDKFWDAVSTRKTLDYAHQQEMEAAQRKLNEIKAQMDEVKSQMDEVKSQMDEAKAQMDEAKAQMDEAKAQMEEAEAEKAVAKAKAEEAEAKAEEAEAKLLQNKLETACKLKAMGLTTEQIAEAIGLPIEKINNL